MVKEFYLKLSSYNSLERKDKHLDLIGPTGDQRLISCCEFVNVFVVDCMYKHKLILQKCCFGIIINFTKVKSIFFIAVITLYVVILQYMIG